MGWSCYFRRVTERKCINKEVQRKVQPELKEEVLEEPGEGGQPGTVNVTVRHSLSLAAEGAGVGGGREPLQIHTRAQGSVTELPTNTSVGSQDLLL